MNAIVCHDQAENNVNRLELGKIGVTKMMEAMLVFNKVYPNGDRFSLCLFDDVGEKLFDLKTVDQQ